MKEKRYYTEIIYESLSGDRFWHMKKPQVSKKGNAYFSINGMIYDTLFTISPLHTIITDNNVLLGVWLIDENSKVSEPRSFRGIPMRWYNSPDLEGISIIKLLEQEDSIFKYLEWCNVKIPEHFLKVEKTYW